MNRFKLFIENFLIYGLGGVIGKMIPFFMLPVITRLFPSSYYMGLNDMSNTILSFAQAFAIMGMYDAMFRMFFEHDSQDYKKEICSSTLAFVLVASTFIFLIMLLFKDGLSIAFFGDRTLSGLIVVTALGVLFGATNSIVAAPTRMENKRKIYLLTNFLTPAISFSISVFLLFQHQYVYALPVGHIVAALSLELIFIVLNRNWFSFRKVRWIHIKTMLAIGLPLLPNFLIYWIFNSCDRIMISKILGMEYTGVYAVGAKFGQISQLIYTAFAGGWQYFAFSTMRDNDQVELTSRIFEYLGTLSLAATIVVTLGTRVLFVPLFGNAYAEAASTVPYLFMAPLAQMLFQISANQFLVIKKTWPSSCILFCGAVGNIGLNAILIPLIGIEGAAIATLAGFILSVITGVAVLQHMKLFKMSLRFYIVTMLYVVYFLVDRLWGLSFGMAVLVGALTIGSFLICYRRDISSLFMIIKGKKI